MEAKFRVGQTVQDKGGTTLKILFVGEKAYFCMLTTSAYSIECGVRFDIVHKHYELVPRNRFKPGDILVSGNNQLRRVIAYDPKTDQYSTLGWMSMSRVWSSEETPFTRDYMERTYVLLALEVPDDVEKAGS